MAVYTHISMRDLEEHLKNYDLREPLSLTGLTEGIDNTNYKINTMAGEFVLTIFEDRIHPDDLPFYLGLMQHFHEQGIPCPELIKNNDGGITTYIKQKPSAIVTFMPGRAVRRIENFHLKALGHTLGRMHHAGRDFPLQLKNQMSLPTLRTLIDACRQDAEKLGHGVAPFLEKELNFQEERLDDIKSHLPQGAIHGDLFPDNIFFDENGNLSAVLDFYFSCTDVFVYDLMVVINAWCFNKGGKIDITRMNVLLNAYKKERVLSSKERSALMFFGRVAALRIIASRMYDWFHPTRGAIVSPHDPVEYINILKFYQSGFLH